LIRSSLDIFNRLRDRETSIKLAKKIHKIARELEKDGFEKINIMHVCGTHEHTITYYGLRALLPNNVNVIAGPGCPVCIVPAREVDEAIKLAEEGIRVFTYGDMYRVPGSRKSLAQARAHGANVIVVYGFMDAIRISRKDEKQSVFFGVGFETTAPTVASFFVRKEVPRNLLLLPSYRITVPAVRYILQGDHNLTGIIAPGHVSTIIGAGAWSFVAEEYGLPVVIAGFEPIDVLLAILEILKCIKEGKPRTINEYKRVVKWEGNIVAKKIINEVFYTTDGDWRGIGVIPQSRWLLKEEFSEFDARKNFDVKVTNAIDIKPGCKCAEIILGKAVPTDCPYYLKACTPQHPIGPCMVSSEGTCSIWARFGGHKIMELKNKFREEVLMK